MLEFLKLTAGWCVLTGVVAALTFLQVRLFRRGQALGSYGYVRRSRSPGYFFVSHACTGFQLSILWLAVLALPVLKLWAFCKWIVGA